MTNFHPLFYIFCFFLCIQLYFLIRYFLKLSFFAPEPTPSHSQPEVSVVICAHNEIDNLRERLQSILTQEYPVFEVIVVDDRSHDGSYDWLLSIRNDYPFLKVVRIDEVPLHINHKKYALTIGIKASQYETILLTDADCKAISKNWIAKMAYCYGKDTKIVLGVSQYEKSTGLLNKFIRYETLQTAILYLSLALSGKPYMGIGRNLSYKRSLFLENKGFKEYLNITGGDDDLFVNKHANGTNTAICTDMQATLYSKPKTSWKDFITQKKRHLSVGKFYRKKDKFLLGLYHVSQTMLWIFFIFVIGVGQMQEILLVSLLMALRMIGQCVVFRKTSTKFGDINKLWLFPLLEILFNIYYWVIGTNALLSKKVKWK
ncbi:glycosyltransferase [Marivirga sp. S37H4]|uniref:Glycosyltransferase n=1 Tax=Marivirga aurantiaca TaxID=2802615 RepID=A0A934WW37_9BACT|nr:glycosyltransferase [Marivirga aurantiaca]MBK6264032.1 glycosyltransferase [Marivirga aurantiaca]